MSITKVAKKANQPKARYTPNAAEVLLFDWIAALRSGKYKQLKTPCVVMRGTADDYSLQGVLADMLKVEPWELNDPIFKTPSLEGYAYELPLSITTRLSKDGLTNTEIIQLIDTCYEFDKMEGRTFEQSAAELEQMIKCWIKEKSSEVSLTQADWEEIFLVCSAAVDLTKGTLTATDWKMIAKYIGPHGHAASKGSWKGYMGSLIKKIGFLGEKAAPQYKVIPEKHLAHIRKLKAVPKVAAPVYMAKAGW